MSQIIIPKNEHGVARLFALSLSDSAAQALAEANPQAQAELLGVRQIDTDQVEIFRVGDLGEIGLAGYLREGIDAQEAEVSRDAGKLAAVDGWVMLVHSAAFAGADTTLSPVPELTLIGTYGVQQSDHTKISLESDAASPYTGVVQDPTPHRPAGRANGSLIVVGLAIVIALLAWWAFS